MIVVEVIRRKNKVPHVFTKFFLILNPVTYKPLDHNGVI